MNILTCILNKQYITVCKINVFVLRVHVCRTILYSNGVTVFSIVNIFTVNGSVWDTIASISKISSNFYTT